MQYGSKKDLLKQHPLFQTLGWWQLGKVAGRAHLVEVSKGEVIIRENEPGRALYLVASGRCEAYTRLESGKNRVIEHYFNGDSFGETSLLSGETNWFSVRALNDTLLLKIDKSDFEKLLGKRPEISRELSHRLARRIQDIQSERENAKWSQIIAIGSVQAKLGKSLFGVNVAAALAEETGEPICVVDFSRHPEGVPPEEIPRLSGEDDDGLQNRVRTHPGGFHILSVKLPESTDPMMLRPLFAALVKKYNYVFTILPEGPGPVIDKVFQQSDRVFLLTDSEQRNLYQTRMMMNRLQPDGDEPTKRIDVILVRLSDHLESESVPGTFGQPISYRLPELPAVSRYDVMRDRPYVVRHPNRPYSQNVRRIARQIGNVSVGLALGGGAARGLAHIGVIEVLQKHDIVVDVVAGSSMGALVAAVWAQGASINEMVQFAHEFQQHGGFIDWRDLMVPPTRALFRGDRIAGFLKHMLGDATFSDTRFPLRIVATDLESMRERTFSEGSLVEAVRASISIPVLFEPVWKNGDRLVDGGVLNPIPVRSLEDFGVSRVIAVNPIPRIQVLQEQSGSPSSQRENGTGLWNRITRAMLPFGVGNIVDTLMRSIQAMQSQLATAAGSEADVVIEPVLAEASWFEYDQPEKFIEVGRKTAEEYIEDIRRLVQPEHVNPRSG